MTITPPRHEDRPATAPASCVRRPSPVHAWSRFLSALGVALLVHALPPYNDVLLVVKQGDSDSIAAADYFKAQRHIPDENVVTLPLTGSVPTVAARDAFVQTLPAGEPQRVE